MLTKPNIDKPVFQLPWFRHYKIKIACGYCPVCNKEIKEEEFKDELSKEEYTNSGLCQECQDGMEGIDG